MSLPSQDILDGINELITEITGFQECDDNFAICQRYCLSHVIHHTYPFVNRSTVKNLMNSYVSRFYGHGYFKVSRALEHQIKSFLSHVSLFEKNPQYDVQWCLLSLLGSLSTNLTCVKDASKLLPIDVEEIEDDDINWLEYLKNDLPQFQYSNTDDSATVSAEEDEGNNGIINCIEEEEANEKVEKINFCLENGEKECHPEHIKGGQSLYQIEKLDDPLENNFQLENEKASVRRKNEIQEILDHRLCAIDIANDYKKWGNISEKFDNLLYREGFSKRSQYISELEMMEYILYQFQTGEKIFLKKGLTHPTLLSVTQKTMSNYLESLQPYFKIIRYFKDFINDIKIVKYPELYQCDNGNSSHSFIEEKSYFISSPVRKNKFSKVLFIYSKMISKALYSFEEHIMNIADNLNNYTLIKMQRDIQSHFFKLTSLFYVHGLATKNWKKDDNWICSIRILAVLYNSINNSSTSEMSFIYLDMFLQCFQVFLDIIDTWISFLTLSDPTDEFIITISNDSAVSDNFCTALEVRPFKEEIIKAGVKDVPVLDFISKEMSQVGASLEVLKRLGRFISEDSISKSSSYCDLLNIIKSKIEAVIKVNLPPPEPKIREKKKSIFTICNLSLTPKEDNGMGESPAIGIRSENAHKAKESLEEERKKNCHDHCSDLINSTVQNVYFKKAFENVGYKYQVNRLKDSKIGKVNPEDCLSSELIKKACDQKHGIYPYHKIILESCRQIIGKRISFVHELVKTIVLKDSDFKSHLSLLRSLLLFNDSYLIQPFLVEFFTQRNLWDNSYSITLHIRECLEVRYKELTSFLSIFAQSSSNFPETILEAIDSLTVNYEVKWPLTLIFTPSVMTMYNEIFRLAMKLKWAHWILSNLHFQSNKDDLSANFKQTRHRLQLLRFWFLSSLGLLNNYFTAQMSFKKLDYDLCNNLKEIIQAHSDFINKIYCSCFLNVERSETRSLLFDTFIPLCAELVETWREEKITDAKLTTMETTFANCQLQLSRILSSMEKMNGYSYSFYLD